MPALLGTRRALIGARPIAPLSALLPVGARIANLGHSYEQFGEGGGATLSAQPQISSNVRGPMVHLAALMPNIRRETWRSADARPSSSPRYFSGANHGLSGDTTVPNGSAPGLLSRVPEATAMMPDGYAIDIAVNDIVLGQTGAATVTRTMAIHDAVRAADPIAPIIILNVTPWQSGFGSDSSSTRSELVNYNLGLDAAVKALAGYGTRTFLVDAWGALTDGAPITSWTYGLAKYYYDTLHPTGLGSYKLGKAIQAVLAPLVTPGNYLLDSFWATGNLFPTPVASAGAKSGTSVTGTVPSNMTVNGPSSSSTFVCSSIDNPDVPGTKMLQIDFNIAPSASTNESLGINWNTVSSGVFTAAGGTKWAMFWIELDDDGSGVPSYATTTLGILPAANKAVAMTADSLAAAVRFPAVAEKRWIATHPVQFDGTQTNGKLSMAIYFNPSLRSGSGRLTLRRWWTGEVPDPRIAWHS